MARLFVCCSLGLLALGQVAMAQRFGPVGFVYKVGYSTNQVSDDNGANNPALNAVVTSTSASFFTTYRFNQDSNWHIFSHLKVAVGAGFRGGVYDVAGTPTRISMSLLDLDLLLPARVPLSQQLELQFAIGGNMGFLVRQSANTPKAETLQPAILSEWGIGTRHGSFLGFSIARSFSSYPIWNTSFVFALSAGDIRASRKIR